MLQAQGVSSPLSRTGHTGGVLIGLLDTERSNLPKYFSALMTYRENEVTKPGKKKHLVAEWIHFTLFGIILPTLKLKVYTFGGLSTQQLRTGRRQTFDFSTLSWVQCLMFGADLGDLIVQSLTFGELRLEGLRLCRFRGLPADLAFANLGFRGL